MQSETKRWFGFFYKQGASGLAGLSYFVSIKTDDIVTGSYQKCAGWNMPKPIN